MSPQAASMTPPTVVTATDPPIPSTAAASPTSSTSPFKSGRYVKHSSQGPFTLWCGLTLKGAGQMLRMRPALSWNRWYRIAMLPGLIAANTVAAGYESLRYGRRIAQTELDPAPLIILGHWRSGTTLLHNLLVNDQRYSYPNTYRCIYPFTFLSTESWLKPLTRWLLPKSRPMDNIEAGWDCPQEDEMALCLMTMTSPYVMALRPDRLETYGRFFNPANMTESERRAFVEAMRTYFKKLTVADSRPLCLKSPGHTFRIPMLHELFPDARYVYIHRDPYAVFNSSVHLRRTMNDENSLGYREQPNIEEEVLDVYEDCFHTYERDKALIPAGRLYEMRYESLDANPLAELEQMYSALDLGGFDQLRRTLEPKMKEVREYKKNRFGEDREKHERIYHRLKPMYDRFNYPPPNVKSAEPAVA